MGQNGTFAPSSCEIASASAVFPVPDGPTSNSARPENLRDLTRSTTTPHAYRRAVASGPVLHDWFTVCYGAE